jgi:hypothetical protein
MSRHIFLPGIVLNPMPLVAAHREYLNEWHRAMVWDAEHEDVAASGCLQAAFIELVQDGRLTFDWIGVADACLSGEGGAPLAYSARYGERLYGFTNQATQSTVQAIHTRWWLESARDAAAVDHGRYADLLLPRKLRDGLIYDHDVSETILRHRMKTELTASMAYAVEILLAADRLTDALRIELLASLVDHRKCPPSGYMSAEYFRWCVLRMLGATQHFPVGIAEAIEACAVGLNVGYGDFSIADKRDAYMGTAKRVARDKPIHSPLIACQVAGLIDAVPTAAQKAPIEQRLGAYQAHLRANPMDIPAFQMRDVPIPFGADKTPIEVICAAWLTAEGRRAA